jgi:hypothetical protein
MERRDRATLLNQHFSEPSGLSTVREKPPSVGDYAHFDWALVTEVLMTKSIDILGLGCVAVDDLLYVSSFPAANTNVRVLNSERQCGGLTGAALVTAAGSARAALLGDCSAWTSFPKVIEENFLRQGVEISFLITTAWSGISGPR